MEGTMRFLLRVSMSTEKFNQAAREGSAPEKMRRILEDLKPEAAYFVAHDGKRTGYLVVNMNDVSEIPRLAEPWFLYFDAEIEIQPAMIAGDLERAGIDKLGRKWK